MILYKLKSDLQMTHDLILSLNLVKWLLIWLAVKVIVKKTIIPEHCYCHTSYLELNC